MGSRFEIRAIHSDSIIAHEAIRGAIAEIQRIEQLISSWDTHSQTYQINRLAGIRPVRVDRELFDLIRRSLKISELTEGAFDISFAAAESLWIFDRRERVFPDAERVAQSVEKINYKNILLDEKEQSVFLKDKGMRIGFGAIGKGYAANRAKLIMQKAGIQNGVVDASGDLVCWGKNKENRSWEIAIEDPADSQKIIAWLRLAKGTIVTSGDYEKYTTFEAKRYAHIIDPKTGYPVSGIKSVSIISEDAELADALATAVFVLGKEKGMALINRLKNTECLIIDDKNNLIPSKRLDLNFQK